MRIIKSDSDAIDATRNNRYSVAPLLTLTLRMTVIQTLSIKESKAGYSGSRKKINCENCDTPLKMSCNIYFNLVIYERFRTVLC